MRSSLAVVPAVLFLIPTSYAVSAEGTTEDRTATASVAAMGVERTSDRGSFAAAFLTATSAVNCVNGGLGENLTNASVIARENVVSTGGRPVAGRLLEVFISQFDTCDLSHDMLFGELENPQYQQIRASSASVSGSVELFDASSGLPAGNSIISLEWTGGDSPTQTTNLSRHAFGNVTLFNRSRGLFNDANVGGSMLFEGRDLVATSDDNFGQLGHNTTGSMTITKATR